MGVYKNWRYLPNGNMLMGKNVASPIDVGVVYVQTDALWVRSLVGDLFPNLRSAQVCEFEIIQNSEAPKSEIWFSGRLNHQTMRGIKPHKTEHDGDILGEIVCYNQQSLMDQGSNKPLVRR